MRDEIVTHVSAVHDEEMITVGKGFEAMGNDECCGMCKFLSQESVDQSGSLIINGRRRFIYEQDLRMGKEIKTLNVCTWHGIL